jgi:chromosome segregation ATPase
MAQEEIIFKVGVDTGNSAERVASIDKEFDTLRKSIKDTEKEVDLMTKKFGENSKEADEQRKKLAQLNLSYGELSKAATDVNAKFEDIYGELQPLTTRLGEAEDRLYELALAGKQNTKEYQDLLETVARYRQTQIETDRIVDGAAQTFTQKLGGAIQGAASGFQLVQGASALFGEESEELEKTLLKVQAAMALADGIEGIRTALPMFKNFANTIKTTVVGAFSSLKGAIASTGIGALMIAIGYLIANFDKLKGSMSQSLTSAKNFEQATTKQAEAARIASDNFAEYERTLKRLGYTEEEISNKRKARFKDAIDKTEKEIGASKKVYDEQLKNLKIV